MGIAGLRLRAGAELASARAAVGRSTRGRAVQAPPRSWTSVGSICGGIPALGRLRHPAAAHRAKGAKKVMAMVNVDLSPSTILGSGMVVAGLSLWQIRASKPELSKDMDVVFSSVGVLVGGILIFQGWRLDPLLLFGQLLTVSTAISFAIEAVNLRRQLNDQDGPGKQPYDSDYGRAGLYGQEPRPLPPPQATQFSSMWDDDRYAGPGGLGFTDDSRGVYDVEPEAAYDSYDDAGYYDRSGRRFQGGPAAPPGGAGRYYEEEPPEQWAREPEDDARTSQGPRPWLDDAGLQGGSGSSGFQEPGGFTSAGYDDSGYGGFDSQPPSPPAGSGRGSGSGSRGRDRPPFEKRRNQDDDMMDDWGV